MPIINIELNNVYCFNNFKVNFSYPKKLSNALITNENLKNINTFRYKKANILIGSNASGKTSLIKVIWKTLLFINKKEKNILYEMVNHKDIDSIINMDIADETKTGSFLHRVCIKMRRNSLYNLESSDLEFDVKMGINSIKLSNGDSYELLLNKLDNIEINYTDYNDVLKNFNLSTGWNVNFPATEPFGNNVIYPSLSNEKEINDYLNVLKKVLITLDPSIIDVKKSNEVSNAYVVKYENTDSDVIIQEGMIISQIPYLSSGTKFGINISNLIYNIKNHQNGIYMLDEQFSYINSDIEKAIIATMISLLGNNEQIFITTHNEDVLTMGLPFHTYYFLKKDKLSDDHKISIYCASEAENRNNVSPKIIFDNDVFGTAPDVTSILNLFLDSEEK